MILSILWGLARIVAVFGFIAFVASPAWDWLGGDGWRIEMRAYIRGAIASAGMLIFEIRRFRRAMGKDIHAHK